MKEYYVALTSVSFTDATGQTTQLSPDGYSQAALLDSGTSLTYLTNDVFTQLALGFGATLGSDGSPPGTYFIPCELSNGNGTINYSFGGEGGVTIQVPIANINSGSAFTSDSSGAPSDICVLGMGDVADSGGFSIFGDTFLRSAYAVLDLENKMAALAQADENQASTSNIVVIPTGTAIPSATVTATATGTQLTAIVANTAIPSPSSQGSNVLPGTPTFNLGLSSSTASASASAGASGNNAASNHAGSVSTAALLGLGLVAGMMAF